MGYIGALMFLNLLFAGLVVCVVCGFSWFDVWSSLYLSVLNWFGFASVDCMNLIIGFVYVSWVWLSFAF